MTLKGRIVPLFNYCAIFAVVYLNYWVLKKFTRYKCGTRINYINIQFKFNDKRMLTKHLIFITT